MHADVHGVHGDRFSSENDFGIRKKVDGMKIEW